MQDTDTDTVRKIAYDRTALRSRIVHLGFGAFHRAHQAVYTDALLRLAGGDWGICEISLYSDRLIRAMRAQDHVFAVAETGGMGTCITEIGCVTEAMNPGLDGAAAVIAKLADPQVAIVSLTITEKGYCLDPATGQLDRTNPGVIADLANPDQPVTALGYLVAGLAARRASGAAPFTVLSCDNVADNGRTAKAAVVDFAKACDPALARWIVDHVPFPGTMVDRIVPAATDDTLADIARRLGRDDPCAIACEPFRQWVIADDFAAGRPDWDKVGAQFVADVRPFEDMKLRMLNGAHSFLAYLGYLSGHRYVADTMADPNLRRAARDMMVHSQAPSLSMPQGVDLAGYADQLIDRFANPALMHQTWQIAMDGSQKIPQRWGGALRWHLAQGADFPALAAGLAAWMVYVSGTDLTGAPIDVRDPMAGTLRDICAAHDGPAVVPALLAIRAIFDPEIGDDARVVGAVQQAYATLVTDGAPALIRSLTGA